ncbi:MAG: flagellin [Litorimonas sp.]
MQFSLTPDLLFNTRQSRQNATLRNRLDTVGQEVITGRTSDVIGATKGRTGDAFLIRKAGADVERFRDTAGLAKARISAASLSVSVVRESLSTLSATGRVSLAQGSERDLNEMAETAADLLNQSMSALNRRSGSRHLFSGTQTAGAPLAEAQTLRTAVDGLISAAPDAASAIAAVNDYFDAPGGGFETDIYQGSTADGPRLHVTDTQSYDPLPKADDPVLRDVMKGYALIAGASQIADDTQRRAVMEEGLNLLDGSLGDMIAMETRLGAIEQSVERIEEGFSREASVIAAAENAMLGVDTFDAAAELQALQSQLEASYTVTGRLGSLSLANFLR